jgi:hypothetical protein
MDGLVVVLHGESMDLTIEDIRREVVDSMTPEERRVEEESWRATLAIIGGLGPYLQGREHVGDQPSPRQGR